MESLFCRAQLILIKIVYLHEINRTTKASRKEQPSNAVQTVSAKAGVVGELIETYS